MKNILKYWEKKIRNDFGVLDIGMLKVYGMIPGLILGALFPEFIMKYLWVILTVFGVMAFRYVYLLFVKK